MSATNSLIGSEKLTVAVYSNPSSLREERRYYSTDAMPYVFILPYETDTDAFKKLETFVRFMTSEVKKRNNSPARRLLPIIFTHEKWLPEISRIFGNLPQPRELEKASESQSLPAESVQLFAAQLSDPSQASKLIFEVYMDKTKNCTCDFDTIWENGRELPRTVTLLKMFPDNAFEIERYLTTPNGDLGNVLYNLTRRPIACVAKGEQNQGLPKLTAECDKYIADHLNSMLCAPGDGGKLRDVQARMKQMFDNVTELRQKLIGQNGFFNGGFFQGGTITELNNNLVIIRYNSDPRTTWAILLYLPDTSLNQGRNSDLNGVNRLVAEGVARAQIADVLVKILAAPAHDGEVMFHASRDGFKIQILDWFSVNLLYKYQLDQGLQSRQNSAKLFRMFTDMPGGLWRANVGFDNYEGATTGRGEAK